MKGLIDGLLLFLNNGQIGDYHRNCIDNLLKYKSFDLEIIKDYEITTDKYKNYTAELFLDRKNDNYTSLIKYIQNNKVSFYHCLNNGFSIPKNYDFNYIMTVTNLLPLFYEEYSTLSYNNNFFNKFPYSVMKSDYIVCPSMSSKNDFLDNFSVPQNKVFVNYGCSSSFFNKTDTFMSNVYLKSKFNIDFDYIIFYGDFNKRKNLDKAIMLFNELKMFIKNLHFIICSDNFYDFEYFNSLKNLSSKLQLSNYIHFMDNINLYDKVNLFSNATFFIDLSSYESLNINLIDAFKCEVPIVCSDIDLYKEYFGDYVYYFNDNYSINSVVNYVNNYVYNKDNFTLSKFDSNFNLKILTNIYNSFES